MKALFTCGLFFLCLQLQAQTCGHTSESWKPISDRIASAKPIFSEKVVTMRYIPLKIHYVRHTDGSFSINNDPNLLLEAILQLNEILRPIGVQFYVAGDIHYIDNSSYLITDRLQPIPYFSEKVPGVANVFIVDGWTNPNWASGWGSPDQVELNAVPLSLVAHEFGHFLTLAHTFDTGNGVENVDRTGANANCNVAGDGICDTDADPYGLTAGQYIGAAHTDTLCTMNSLTYDMNNVLYNPPYNNLMSYHAGDCGRIFTPGQYAKMDAGYLTFHANYPDYAGAGMVNAAPSNPALVMLKGIPHISWTNASGAVGTVIEYSTDNGVSWYVAGGVLAAETAYPLYATAVGNTYQIRLKHLNNKDTYSAALSYSPIHSLPVRPNFDRPKPTSLPSIGEVSIQNTTINNNSNTNLGYSLMASNPLDVIQAGTSYPVQLKIGTDANGSGGFSYFAVYLDENNDGDFYDAGETKYIKANGPLEWTVNTSLNVATTAIGGPRILRVRSFYQAGIQDPEKFSVFSETEDYVIQINSPGGTAGLETQGNNQVLLWPNPNNGQFVVQSADEIEAVVVYAATGQYIPVNINPIATGLELSSNALAKGVYFVHVTTGSKTQVLTCIIN